MNDLDRRIQEALRGVDGGDALAREPNIAEELITAFRGRTKWTSLLALFYTFVGLALAIWSGIRSYGAESIREQLLWSGLCLLGVLFISFLKVWFWMEMHTNRVLREVKRIELLFLARDQANTRG